MSSQLSIWVISAETWIFCNKYLLVENIFEALHADRMSGYSGWFLVNQSEKENSRAVTCQCLDQAGQDWKSG